MIYKSPTTHKMACVKNNQVCDTQNEWLIRARRFIAKRKRNEERENHSEECGAIGGTGECDCQ